MSILQSLWSQQGIKKWPNQEGRAQSYPLYGLKIMAQMSTCILLITVVEELTNGRESTVNRALDGNIYPG
jgi:hypothetical protein